MANPNPKNQWKKDGPSPNPKGRPPKGYSFRELYNEYYAGQVSKKDKRTRFQRLMEITEEIAIENKDSSLLRYSMDQNIGKAKETIDANVNGNLTVNIKKYGDKI